MFDFTKMRIKGISQKQLADPESFVLQKSKPLGLLKLTNKALSYRDVHAEYTVRITTQFSDRYKTVDEIREKAVLDSTDQIMQVYSDTVYNACVQRAYQEKVDSLRERLGVIPFVLPNNISSDVFCTCEQTCFDRLIDGTVLITNPIFHFAFEDDYGKRAYPYECNFDLAECLDKIVKRSAGSIDFHFDVDSMFPEARDEYLKRVRILIEAKQVVLNEEHEKAEQAAANLKAQERAVEERDAEVIRRLADERSVLRQRAEKAERDTTALVSDLYERALKRAHAIEAAEREHQKQLEAERLERARQQRLEAERQYQEQLEKERLAQQHLEEERLAREAAIRERQEYELREQEKRRRELEREPIGLPRWVIDNNFQRNLVDFDKEGISYLKSCVYKRTGSKKITGCYVLFNTDLKNKPYVGQAKDIFRRWGEYLRGHTSGGSDAFYQDMVVLGHHFKAIAIPLNGSPYDDLDKMERTLIEQYRAYEIGYNRTRGNK